VRIGIGIQVSSIDGALYGLPPLLDLLEEYQISATVFVSLGPDRSVSWWRRLAGAPFISDAARDELEHLAQSSHEVGLAPFDPVRWEQEAAHADRSWTRRQVMLAADIYERIFHAEPCCFGATGFQVNPHLFEIEQKLGLIYAADVRGQTIFLPRAQRVDSDVPQIPATLPSVADALRQRGVTEGNVHEHLFDLSQKFLPTGQTWRIAAEEEGYDFIDIVEKILVIWRGSQREIGPLGRLLQPVDTAGLRRHQIGWQRSGHGVYVAAQSVPTD
jgi:undecaprenyl phosphate-alpha-L-ara4FN deformylase